MVIQESEGYSWITGIRNWIHPFQCDRSNMRIISFRIRITPAAKSNSCTVTSIEIYVCICTVCNVHKRSQYMTLYVYMFYTFLSFMSSYNIRGVLQ